MNSDRPLSVKPSASAKPPPNKSTIFQGSSAMMSTSARCLYCVLFLAGNMNSASAAVIATVPSLIRLAFSSSRDQPGMLKLPITISFLNTQHSAVRLKTTATAFSSYDIGVFLAMSLWPDSASEVKSLPA